MPFQTKCSFTLIELIVVIAIIAILAAIIAPNAFKAIEKAKMSEAVGDFKSYKTALYSLYSDTGQWGLAPGAGQRYVRLDQYNALIRDTGLAGWDGPYVEKLKGKTPWQGTYVVQSDNCTGNAAREIWLEFEDACYSGGGSSCGLALATKEKLDSMVDDGDCRSGDFRVCSYGGSTNWCYCSGNDTMWVFVYDAW